MEQSQYKSNAELKYLARTQMMGRFGLLIGTMLITFLISFFCSSILISKNYFVNYAVSFVIQVILSVLQVGITLIFMKSSCNMPAQQRNKLSSITEGKSEIRQMCGNGTSHPVGQRRNHKGN